MNKMKTGVELIADERKRQIEVEGWDAKHDDKQYGALALAGASYAIETIAKYKDIDVNWGKTYSKLAGIIWPYDMIWWKPTPDDPVRQLVKAGALIAAEIDRLQRMKLSSFKFIKDCPEDDKSNFSI